MLLARSKAPDSLVFYTSNKMTTDAPMLALPFPRPGVYDTPVELGRTALL